MKLVDLLLNLVIVVPVTVLPHDIVDVLLRRRVLMHVALAACVAGLLGKTFIGRTLTQRDTERRS